MIVQFALYPVLALYLVSTFCYLSALVGGRKRLEKWGYYALLAGFGFHVLTLAHRYAVIGYTPITNIHESLSFLALCVAGFFIFLRRALRDRNARFPFSSSPFRDDHLGPRRAGGRQSPCRPCSGATGCPSTQSSPSWETRSSSQGFSSPLSIS